ncbi:hypothetical protein BH11PSE11_BH11PSE11_33260 [soil metagenome]
MITTLLCLTQSSVLFSPGVSHAQSHRRNASLNEEVVMIPAHAHPAGLAIAAARNGVSSGLANATSTGPIVSSGSSIAESDQRSSSAKAVNSSAVRLETTIFRPPGDGPFPVLVLNHGKAIGNTHLQERARFLAISREFVQRGYAVIIPMRTGFAKSTGEYSEAPCNMTANGQMQANDVESILRYVRRQSWADPERILVGGQSYGGLATLALGTRNAPGVRGLINFAGGLRMYGGDCSWRSSLIDAFADFGGKTAIPSLWFYGDNDSHFDPALVTAMHRAYVQRGASARLVAYGPFKKDAHSMSSSRDGVKIWWPEMEKFLRDISMPTDVVVALQDDPSLQRSDFAPLDDIDAIPYLKENGREQYRVFLGKSLPRAFAISAAGTWSWAEDGDDPVERVLANCESLSASPCKLYAVDNDVVWKGQLRTGAKL